MRQPKNVVEVTVLQWHLFSLLVVTLMQSSHARECIANWQVPIHSVATPSGNS